MLLVGRFMEENLIAFFKMVMSERLIYLVLPDRGSPLKPKYVLSVYQIGEELFA